MCGWIGNGMLAVSPRRRISRWKPMGLIGPPRSETNTWASGAVHQALDLALGEIASLDCQVFGAWCVFLGCRFHADKPSRRGNDCLAYAPFLNSQTAPAVALAPNRHAKLSAPPRPPRPQHWCGRCAPRWGTFGFWKLLNVSRVGRALRGKEWPGVANSASLPSNLFRAIQAGR